MESSSRRTLRRSLPLPSRRCPSPKLRTQREFGFGGSLSRFHSGDIRVLRRSIRGRAFQPRCNSGLPGNRQTEPNRISSIHGII